MDNFKILDIVKNIYKENNIIETHNVSIIIVLNIICLMVYDTKTSSGMEYPDVYNYWINDDYTYEPLTKSKFKIDEIRDKYIYQFNKAGFSPLKISKITGIAEMAIRRHIQNAKVNTFVAKPIIKKA